MFQLARELPPPVILTATTHLGLWQAPLADEHRVVTKPGDLSGLSPSGVILVTGEVQGERTKGLGGAALSRLREEAARVQAPLLIEVDGSREKPLKAPAAHEPAIPRFVESLVQVAGLSGVGKPIDEEHLHRPEIFARLSGLQPGEEASLTAVARVLAHPQGGLKNIPRGARRVALLNQADTPRLQAQARSIARPLLAAYDAVVIASLQEKRIHSAHEPVAGIVLAAGGSRRFGRPKQLLDWRGEPFVRAVTKTAFIAGLSPLIVVTGAHADEVASALEDLPVEIVHNQDWQNGQAASIRAGMSSLPGLPKNLGKGDPQGRVGARAGGTIFLLADQPQITATILHALMEEHASTLAPIVGPMVQGQRANPVLFDRVTFPDLVGLEGDVGGRAIFSKYKVSYLPWHDDALLLDVDTPEHYQRLKDRLE